MFQSSVWFRHFPRSALTRTENILLWVSRTTGARLSSGFASADTCMQHSSQHKGKLSKPPVPSTPPAGRCFLFLFFLSWYGTTCQVQCLNTKHSLFLQCTEGCGIRQVKFCRLHAEFLDYILIKELLLSDASRTAYVPSIRKPILVYLHIASLLWHCQRLQFWARWWTEILGSPE